MSEESLFPRALATIWVVDVADAAQGERIDEALAAGVTALWLRDPAATGRALYDAAGGLLLRCRRQGAALLVGDRVDVAMAVGADGVQLGARSVPAPAVRRWYRGWMGVSCHGATELSKARDGGRRPRRPVAGVRRAGEGAAPRDRRVHAARRATSASRWSRWGGSTRGRPARCARPGRSAWRPSAPCATPPTWPRRHGRSRVDDPPVKGGGHTPSAVPRRWPLLFSTLLGLAVAGAGCQHGKGRRGADGGPAGPGRRARRAAPSPPRRGPPPQATSRCSRVEPGAYAADDRYLALARDFDERVRRAGDRMDLATGLSFRDRAPPRVVLCPLGDETVPWRMEREIVEGRRRAVLRVNVEPLVVGQGDPDRVLLHALAAAAVEGGARGTRPPAWFTVYVGCLAAGDLADRLDRAARAAARAGRTLEVDPGDPAKAEATAFGAGLLLAEKSTAPDLRRLVALVADGEDPSRLLPKWVHDDAGMWVGAAREILGGRDVADRPRRRPDGGRRAGRARGAGPGRARGLPRHGREGGRADRRGPRGGRGICVCRRPCARGRRPRSARSSSGRLPRRRSSAGCATRARTSCSRRGATRRPAASRCGRSRC